MVGKGEGTDPVYCSASTTCMCLLTCLNGTQRLAAWRMSLLCARDVAPAPRRASGAACAAMPRYAGSSRMPAPASSSSLSMRADIHTSYMPRLGVSANTGAAAGAWRSGAGLMHACNPIPCMLQHAKHVLYTSYLQNLMRIPSVSNSHRLHCYLSVPCTLDFRTHIFAHTCLNKT